MKDLHSLKTVINPVRATLAGVIFAIGQDVVGRCDSRCYSLGGRGLWRDRRLGLHGAVLPVSGLAYVRANCKHLTVRGVEIENLILEFLKEPPTPSNQGTAERRRPKARTSSYR